MKKYFYFIAFISCLASICAPRAHGLPSELLGPPYRNELEIVPITISDMGVGLGLSWERFLSQNVSIVLPFFYSTQKKESGQAMDLSNTRFNDFFAVAPGLKFYPNGRKRLSYAIGPNVQFEYGTGTDRYLHSDPTSESVVTEVTFRRYRWSLLISNYFEFQISKRASIGLVGAFGLLCHDKSSFKSSFPSVPESKGIDLTGRLSVVFGIGI